MKIEYIKPLVAATRKVLSTMAFVESTAKKPFLKEGGDKKGFGDVSAVIELDGTTSDGEAIKGSLAISFTKACILNIAEQLFGEEYTEINEEVKDIAGEIMNMTCGEARRGFAKLGQQFKAGIPSISTGEAHQINHFVEGRVVLIPFETSSGEYYVEAIFK